MWTLLSSKELEGERSPLRTSFAAEKGMGRGVRRYINLTSDPTAATWIQNQQIHKISNKQRSNLS
jgi:hypothetical protein